MVYAISLMGHKQSESHAQGEEKRGREGRRAREKPILVALLFSRIWFALLFFSFKDRPTASVHISMHYVGLSRSRVDAAERRLTTQCCTAVGNGPE